MAVRVRFPLRVLQPEFAIYDSGLWFFVLVRGNQSVGGGMAELSAIVCVGELLRNNEHKSDV